MRFELLAVASKRDMADNLYVCEAVGLQRSHVAQLWHCMPSITSAGCEFLAVLCCMYRTISAPNSSRLA